MTVQLSNFDAVLRPEADDLIIAGRSKGSTRWMVGRDLAQGSDDIRQSGNGLQQLSAWRIGTDRLVCTASEDGILIIDQNGPYGSGMAFELGGGIAVFQVPDSCLCIPSAAHDRVTVEADVQCADVVGVSKQQALGIIGG